MHKFTKALAAIGLAAVMSQSAIAENLKLGFLVKQPEEPWFQTEWKFADKAGKDLGFEVIKIAVPDGEKTLNAIDSLAASGAKGFVICTPDPKLGSAIAAKARGYDMKVILLDEPTRGIDVGAKHEIYNVIYELAKRGVAVLFASSDLPEVLGVADRIVVMREGEIAGELLHEQANEQQALNLAMPKVSQAVA